MASDDRLVAASGGPRMPRQEQALTAILKAPAVCDGVETLHALHHTANPAHAGHLAEARRVLALPVEASRLHWHPFGVYAVPLAKRHDGARSWSRRLHLWHPDAMPVGEASPYGVHTHTGTARSHVVAGTLQHHLYAFAPDGDGAWQQAELGEPRGRARLVAHLEAPTHAGMTHVLPAHQPHGVSRPPGRVAWAVSLFEQLDPLPGEAPATQFTTWQRLDVAAEPLVLQPPVPVRAVAAAALAIVDEALHANEAGATTTTRALPIRP